MDIKVTIDSTFVSETAQKLDLKFQKLCKLSIF